MDIRERLAVLKRRSSAVRSHACLASFKAESTAKSPNLKAAVIPRYTRP
jgi:hypothetical protein